MTQFIFRAPKLLNLVRMTKIFIAAIFIVAGIREISAFGDGNYHCSVSTRLINLNAGDTLKNPALRLEEITISSFKIVSVRDTVAGAADFGRVMAKDYGELYGFVGQRGLRPGRPMVFYFSGEPPFIIEVGVEVLQLPEEPAGRISGRTVEGGRVVVAHYQGPYEQIKMAYAAIGEWIKQKNERAGGPPYEVYRNDPATTSDPYELLTDVYQPVK